MTVDLVTITDTLANAESSSWVEVSPQITFTDADGRTWNAGKKIKGVYDDALTLKAANGADPFQVPASDAAGNVPTPVLYRVRRVLGSGTAGWTNVSLPKAAATVDLDSLTEAPGTTVTVPAVVLTVEGVAPDSAGNVDLPTSEGGSAYTHDQAVASTTWTVVHNLGYRPNVFLTDSSGTPLLGTVTHDSANQLTVTFTSAIAGLAYLS